MPLPRHPLFFPSLSLPFLSSFSRLFARTNSPAHPHRNGRPTLRTFATCEMRPKQRISLFKILRGSLFYLLWANTLLTFGLVYIVSRSFGGDLLNLTISIRYFGRKMIGIISKNGYSKLTISMIWIGEFLRSFFELFFWEAIRIEGTKWTRRISNVSLQIWRRSINILSPGPRFSVIKIYRIVHHSTFSSPGETGTRHREIWI